MNTRTGLARRRTGASYGLAVTPALRWLVNHHSVPFGQSWKTRCERCGATLWPGACRPSGRCRTCQTRHGPPPLLLEAATLLTAGGLLASGMRDWELAAYAAWAIGAIVLAFIDVAVLRLPHRLVAATSIAFLALLPADEFAHWLRACAGGAVLVAFFGLIAFAAPRHLGLGDVAVAFPVGAALGWQGWTDVSAGILLALVAASVTAVALRLSHRLPPGTQLPLGPFLLASAFAVSCTP
jgi:leader peptidase (prepilin peptidase)/N-methyltransferase